MITELSREYSVSQGPCYQDIFIAAMYATRPAGERPELTLWSGVGAVFLDFVNGPTWLGHRSKFMRFEGRGKMNGLPVEVVVNTYDTHRRTGDMAVSPIDLSRSSGFYITQHKP